MDGKAATREKLPSMSLQQDVQWDSKLIRRSPQNEVKMAADLRTPSGAFGSRYVKQAELVWAAMDSNHLLRVRSA
jgi:hypothetical protein